MKEVETLKLGQTELNRTPYGSVWFIDVNGNKSTFSDEMTANKFFEAARNGSGQTGTTKRVDIGFNQDRNAKGNDNVVWREVNLKKPPSYFKD
ncbi:conserved hypothetical protein [Candidatus Terasakiella magnetica]|uniref:Uncharacterized protein n=1 Tax=Candidatus Terasakiella magnetica TaxID=1867952 RepID=A0A1C3RC72_9PROT|nr:hypothetical protein [Candidatus Terasakiella magnetica]SCA54834.1 conserved hypothetical protein [Candidatus Terasakiella magnetica]